MMLHALDPVPLGPPIAALPKADRHLHQAASARLDRVAARDDPARLRVAAPQLDARLRAAPEGLGGVDCCVDPYATEADPSRWAERAASAGLGITIHAGYAASAPRLLERLGASGVAVRGSSRVRRYVRRELARRQALGFKEDVRPFRLPGHRTRPTTGASPRSVRAARRACPDPPHVRPSR